MKKKISDETKATIFAFVWEAFLYLGFLVELISGETWGYYLWFIDTAVQVTMLIYDAKLNGLEKSLNRTRRRLARQSAEFTNYIKAHEKPATNESTVTIIDIVSMLRKHGKR